MSPLISLATSFAVLFAGAIALAQPSEPAASLQRLCTQDVAALRESLMVEPKVLATRAASAGDLRYLEWYGFVSAIPGISDQQCVREDNFYKPFRGTSDALCSEEHRVLYERSYAFAEQYNKHMASQRAAMGMKSCDGR